MKIYAAKAVPIGCLPKIWGKAQTFRSAFVVKRYGNGVFKRTSKARFPIEQLWGPSVPKEMLRDQAYAAWQDQHPRILAESSRLIALMLSGAELGGRRQGAQPH